MTADERLALIRNKSERAQKHLTDLQVEIRAFRDSKPCVVAAKRDPQTRKPIHYVHSVKDVPVPIPLIIGDALQCLRSTLDHLAYQLVLVGGSTVDIYKIQFPIGRDIGAYKSERGRVVKGMRQAAIDAIDAVEPYHGGKGALLWTLHNLNNIDKHRAILTAGASHLGVDIIQDLMRLTPNRPAAEGIPFQPFFVRPTDDQFPLKAGDELYIGLPDEKVDENRQFLFDVAFAESEVVEGKPILPTLHEMRDFINGIVTTFWQAGHLS